MKKNILKTVCSLMLSALLISGCQKVTEKELIAEDPVTGNDGQEQANNRHGDNDNGCRLSHVNQGFGFAGPDMDFHYNHKGLADIWLLDYGEGDFEEHSIKYDHKNRIKGTRIIAPVFLPGDAINYTFYSSGNFTTRALGYLESGPIWADIYYTYNHKGQMVREDDMVNDYHTRFYYDNRGYNTRIEFYIGTDLYALFHWKYDIPNRNPYLSVNGVDFGFPIYTWPLFDKRFNSSGTIILYDNGTPIVVAEDDPAQTVIQTGRNNYATNAHYYDIPAETPYDIVFTYENCGRGNDDVSNEKAPSTAKRAGPVSVKNRVAKILSRHSKNMKQELQVLKTETLNNNRLK